MVLAFYVDIMQSVVYLKSAVLAVVRPFGLPRRGRLVITIIFRVNGVTAVVTLGVVRGFHQNDDRHRGVAFTVHTSVSDPRPAPMLCRAVLTYS